MTQAPVGTSGLVRVTVASGTRRVDLVLPGAVPVAELVPELARSVGLLDASTAHGGFRLVTSEGRRLTGDAGLVLQGIEDGSLITVTAGVDVPEPRVYDDVVEAMADVVEQQLRPWAPEAGRRTALAAATMLLALGAVALLAQASSLAGIAAAVVSGALVVAAVVLSRGQDEPEAAVVVAWTGAGYAATAALVLADAEELLGLRLAAAGGALALVGLACLVGLGVGRVLLVPAVVVGAVLGACGLVVGSTDLSAAVLLSCVTTFVVLVGSVFPWLALGVTGTRAPAPDQPGVAAPPVHVDPDRVAADARVAHEILVAITATVGILLVVTAPVAVGLGALGAVLAAAASLVVMFRTRQYHLGSEVLTGLVAGSLGLLATTVTVLVERPDWQPTLAVVLAAAGAALLLLTLVPSAPSLRRGRLGDLVESLLLLALVPLLVLAVGLADQLPG